MKKKMEDNDLRVLKGFDLTRQKFDDYRLSKRNYRGASNKAIKDLRKMATAAQKCITAVIENGIQPSLTSLVKVFSPPVNRIKTPKKPKLDRYEVDTAFEEFKSATQRFHKSVFSYQLQFRIFNYAYKLYFAHVFKNLKEKHGFNNHQISEVFGMWDTMISGWIADEASNAEERNALLERHRILIDED